MKNIVTVKVKVGQRIRNEKYCHSQSGAENQKLQVHKKRLTVGYRITKS